MYYYHIATALSMTSRKFRTKYSETGDRSIWTDTPAEKARKAAVGHITLGVTYFLHLCASMVTEAKLLSIIACIALHTKPQCRASSLRLDSYDVCGT